MKKLIVILSLMIMPMIVYGSSTGANRTYDVAVATFVGNNTVGSDQIINDSINPAVDIGAGIMATDVVASSVAVNVINNKHIRGCVLDSDVIVSSITAGKVTRGTILADAIDSTKIGATTLDADVVVSSITINKVGTNQIINDGVSPVNDIGAGILANDVIVSSVGVGAITKAIMTGVEVSSFPMKPFACVHVDTNSVITCGSNALFYICKGTWTGAYELDEGRMFTVSNGTITYTGATKHYFNIVCAMTISGTTNGVRPHFRFYLNGVPYVKGEQHTVLGTANDEKMIVMNCLEDLSTNETVSLYVRCEVNGDKVEIHHSAITIFQVD